MRYFLRTLMILMALLPPVLSIGYARWERYREHQKNIEAPWLMIELHKAREWERQVNASNGYVSPAVRQEWAVRKARADRLLSQKK
jgi:hypothetical protein